MILLIKDAGITTSLSVQLALYFKKLVNFPTTIPASKAKSIFTKLTACFKQINYKMYDINIHCLFPLRYMTFI